MAERDEDAWYPTAARLGQRTYIDPNAGGGMDGKRDHPAPDHPHEVTPVTGHYWERCVHCGLGEAAHATSIGAIPF